MEEQIIKILHQPLKAKYYRMIESGEKPEEYREATPYWCKRFCGFNTLLFSFRNGYEDINKAGYTHVQFSLGYPKKDDASRRMTFELKAIEYREGREEWGAEKGKKYLVEVLGRRTTLDGTKLWEDWPMKIRLIENAMCAHDLHELTNYPRPWFKAKPMLPKGTVLTVKEQWTNFFGSYYRCDHENGTYDIKRSEAEIIEM